MLGTGIAGWLGCLAIETEVRLEVRCLEAECWTCLPRHEEAAASTVIATAAAASAWPAQAASAQAAPRITMPAVAALQLEVEAGS